MGAPSLNVFAAGIGVVTGDQLNTFQQTCDNISQLRAFTGVSGIQVYVRGYVTPADGGQGAFYWNATSTATDDGVSVIRPTGAIIGAWLRLSNDAPNGAAGVFAIEWRVDGAGSPIAANKKSDLYVPMKCTIQSAVVQADQVGTLVLDVWVKPFVAGNSPPVIGNSIVASAPPSLTSQQASKLTLLTGWTTLILPDSAVRFNVTSTGGVITAFTLTLNCSPTL